MSLPRGAPMGAGGGGPMLSSGGPMLGGLIGGGGLLRPWAGLGPPNEYAGLGPPNGGLFGKLTAGDCLPVKE